MEELQQVPPLNEILTDVDSYCNFMILNDAIDLGGEVWENYIWSLD